MTDETKKLAIIAAGGDLPKTLISACQETQRPFFVVALEGVTNPNLVTDQMDHMWTHPGAIGHVIKAFHEQGVEQLVMAGHIKRPPLKSVRPDARGMKVLAKIGFKGLGDDGLLRLIAEEFEKDGFELVGADDVVKELLAPEGVLGKHKPGKQAKADIQRGLEVAQALGAADVGQSVIVQQGIVLGLEAIEGTDELMKRCQAYKRDGDAGVLVKIKKPGQESRFDLPTIGTDTIQNAADNGLQGIAIHAGNALILNREEVIALANKLCLFIVGVEV